MNKKLFLGALTCALLALPLAISSCSSSTPRPKTAEDERNNKGHETPTSADVTLRSGILKPGGTFSESTTYDDVDWSKSTEQKITIKNYDPGAKSKDTLHVESAGKTPGRVYALEISYKNAAGQPMNDQLISADQLDRHQHFFRQVLQRTDKDTNKDYDKGYTYVDINAPHLLLYKYAYTDVYHGAKNPVGLKGLIYFDKPTDSSEAEAQVHIVLQHFYNTKFTDLAGRKVRPYYIPSAPQSEPDITLQVFFRLNEKSNH